MTVEELQSRSALLLGDEGMAALRNAKVLVFGVGGVGSWCVESLVRSGLGAITIVDGDSVCSSNINRQLMATTLTIGQSKVEVFKEHLLTINPLAEITAIHGLYNASTADDFNLGDYDYVVDCIDSVADKTLLILNATASKTKFFSSMGAALKMDPTRIKVAEFFNVKGCPLARAIRQRLKRLDTRPRRKFKCVYSDELLQNKATSLTEPRANGSLMHITAIFGLTLAGLIISDISHQSLRV